MAGRPHEGWRKSGWRASADGGRVIEYTLSLPLTYNIYVERDRPGKPWRIRFGACEQRPGSYKTPIAAMLAAEDQARTELRASLRELGGGAHR